MRQTLAIALLGAMVAAYDYDCQSDGKKHNKDTCNEAQNCSWCNHQHEPIGCFADNVINQWQDGTYECGDVNNNKKDDYSFIQHISQFGLSYGTIEEFNFRKDLYEAADREINAHNNKNTTWTLGHNFMSTMTSIEKASLFGYRSRDSPKEYVDIQVQDLPTEVNWVEKGAVNPAQNQGQCGSCWAFSTVGGIEGADAIKNGTLRKFSEQQLVDCSEKNLGCSGGDLDAAYDYYEDNYAILEGDYGYKAKYGVCKYESSPHTKVEVKRTNDVKMSSEALKTAVAQQPVSVAIEADKMVFSAYKSGILTGPACGTKLDHGVLVVGYGSENGTEYYLVKNSWGSTWGVNGYIKIGIEDGKGVCGIQQDAVYPTLM